MRECFYYIHVASNEKKNPPEAIIFKTKVYLLPTKSILKASESETNIL